MTFSTHQINRLSQQIQHLHQANLLDRVAHLEQQLDQQHRKPDDKGKSKLKDKAKAKAKAKAKVKANTKAKGKHSHIGKNKKLCVFKKCPAGTIPKNKILDGQLTIDDGTLCTFHTCPAGTTGSGWIGEGSNKTRLCAYAKCPKGSKELADKVKTK